MKKQISILLTIIISISISIKAKEPITHKSNYLKKLNKNISQNKLKYSTATIITAAALYDYYANNADLMRNAAIIAEKYYKIGFNKTTISTQKLTELVKTNPVVAIASISGAAIISASTLHLYKKNKTEKHSSTYKSKVDSSKNIVVIEETLGKNKTVKPIELIKIKELNLPYKIVKHLKKFTTIEDLPEDLTSIKGIGPKFSEIIWNTIGLKIN